MKKNIAVSIIILVLSMYGFSQEKTSGLLERSEIEEKYKWDTGDVYENDLVWEADYRWLEQNLSRYNEYKGHLGESAQILSGCLQLDETIGEKMSYLWLYAKLNRDVDMNKDQYQLLWSRYTNLNTRLEVARSFIQPEIISIPEKSIQKFMDEEGELKTYKHYFETLAAKKPHTLSKEKEEDLARVSQIVENPYGVFGSLVYSELPFPVIKDDLGNDIQLNRSTSWRARSSKDRLYRKTGYQEYYKNLGAYKGTLTKNLNGLIDGKVYLANARNYSSTLEASLDRYNIPVEVYKNLIESVRANLQVCHRWMKMKKELLLLDTLYLYDTRVSMFPGIPAEYTWEEARDLTLESLAPMGEDYLEDIENAYNNRWIDAYSNVGKETGGYSSGPAGPHPYVKMNWGGTILDFYTLIHELGHYVHATSIMKSQPRIYYDYPSFLSEVASTTAENISQFYLIENSPTKAEKLYHMEQYLDNVIMMVYNSTMMAEFELKMYQKVENGDPLSAKDLNEAYGLLLKEYYGDDITLTEIDKFAWMEYPHYYLDYYLYSYATSFAASIQIASNILIEGEPALKRFRNFLECGNSAYPVDAIKKAGVDLTSPEPFYILANKMNELMNEIENYCKLDKNNTCDMENNTRSIQLKDGRKISYQEYGQAEGFPVLFFHGFPGSNLDVMVFNGPELASRLNIRLIAVNRPSYNGSDSMAGRELLDWPDDVSQFADKLGLDKFSILAYSGGGPFGLACAYKIPERINKVAIVSGMGPASAPEAKKGAAMTIPKAPKLILKGFTKMLQNKPDKFRANMRKGFPEVDQLIFDIAEVEEALLNSMNASLYSGYQGALQDARIYKGDWKFDLEEIKSRVYLWHGEEDRNVKIATGRYVAEKLPDCVFSMEKEEGHLSLIYKQADEVFKILVSEF